MNMMVVKGVLNSHNFCIILLTTARWFVASIIALRVAITVFIMEYALTRRTFPVVNRTSHSYHTKHYIETYVSILGVIYLFLTIIIISIIFIVIIMMSCICIAQICWPWIIYTFNSHSPYVLLPLSSEIVIALWWWNY